MRRRIRRSTRDTRRSDDTRSAHKSDHSDHTHYAFPDNAAIVCRQRGTILHHGRRRTGDGNGERWRRRDRGRVEQRPGSSGLAQGGTAWSAQVPLLNGANTITFTASDAALATVSRVVVVTRQVVAGPVVIQLNYPAGTGAFTTTQSPVSLQGSASQSSGIRSITWSTDKGASGKAAGTNPWNTGAIPLQAGLNTVSLWWWPMTRPPRPARVLITYAGSSSRDTTAPSLTIFFPASVISATTSDSMVVRGSASDNTGVTSVVWFTAAGASGNATGTTSWSTSTIPLIRGDNSIVIRAFDAAGNMAWRSLSVTRQ